MKKLGMTLAIGVLITSLAIPAFARGRGWGGMGGHMGGSWGGGPGSCGQYDRGGYGYQRPDAWSRQDQRDEAFYRDTAQMRDQIRTKSAELDALLNSPNPDLERARSLQKEISQLQAKMDEKRLNYELEERKRNPEARYGRGNGWDYGPSMRGFGPGMDYGHMGGYGPGRTWY